MSVVVLLQSLLSFRLWDTFSLLFSLIVIPKDVDLLLIIFSQSLIVVEGVDQKGLSFKGSHQ